LNRKIGFIGLGTMGKPMALNLVKAGYSLICFNRSKAPVKELVAAGAEEALSISELAARSDVIITMLPADKEIMKVYTGEGGILHAIRDGSVCIDMTSARGDTIKEIARIASDMGKNVTFLDAPVSGGQAGAQNGTLTIMVGGDKNKVEEYRPIFEVLGSKIFYTGALGSGKAVKMINQLLNAGNTYIMSEALFLAKTMDLDMELLVNVINESSGTSWVFKNNAPKHVIPQNFEQGFRLELMKKDLGLSIEQAQKNHLSLPVVNLIYQIYEAMSNQGYDKKNYNVVSQWIYQQNKPITGENGNV